MATVSEIDGKLDELKRQAAALKEQRKIAAAKEREQARKWKAATLAAIGETVLKTLGADWTDIDLEGLQGWLADNAEDIRLMAVTDPRTPVEAKEALDAFKRSSKPKRTGKPDAVEDVTEMPETIDMAEDEKQADWYAAKGKNPQRMADASPCGSPVSAATHQAERTDSMIRHHGAFGTHISHSRPIWHSATPRACPYK